MGKRALNEGREFWRRVNNGEKDGKGLGKGGVQENIEK